MKKIFIIQILLVFYSIYAQSKSVQEVMKYYPLTNGNYWEYDVASGSDPYHYSVSPLYWLEIIGDTILSNNKTYKVIHRGSFYDKRIVKIFERIDTSDASVYRYHLDYKLEFKIDRLLSKPGDRIYANRFGPITNPLPKDFGLFCYAEEKKLIFGKMWEVKKMNANTRIPNELYELAKGLGFVFSETWEGSYWSERLQYARIDGIEYGIKTDVTKSDEIPNQFILFQNYPNPFNPSTTIKYSIPVETLNATSLQHVVLKVYDILGSEVVTLVNEEKIPGEYEVKFNASSLPSGVYFYRLQSGSFSQTRKFVLMK